MNNRNILVIDNQEFIAPSSWSSAASYIAGSKYARIKNGVKEGSVWEILHRIAFTIFNDDKEKAIDLFAGMLKQEYAFNSPVWFNVGIEEKPQVSACYILNVEDDTKSITDWWTNQTFIYKFGSGMGADLSKLRERGAVVRGSGRASGPLSFAKVADTIGGVMRSGGVSRRAAAMLTLHYTHPDIEEFIKAKAATETLLNILKKEGIDSDNINSSVYDYIYHQQANRAVRFEDKFFEDYFNYRDVELISPLNGVVVGYIPARRLLRLVAESLWKCGDPGVQFSDTINSWHTLEGVGKIVSSNPCLSRTTKLLTTSGLKTIDQIFCSDTIWTPNGWVLTQVWKTGTKQVVKVTLSNGQSITLTPDHKIKVGEEWRSASDTLGSKIAPLTGSGDWGGARFRANHSSRELTQLGFIQGDGTFRKDGSLEVHIGKKDGDVDKLFEGYCKHSNSYRYVPASDKLTQVSYDLEMCRTSLPDRHMPRGFWQLSSMEMCKFLKGLYSANGSVIKNHGRVSFKTTCKQLAEEIQTILLALGFRPYITTTKSKKIKWDNGEYVSRESYGVEIASSDLSLFSSYIGFIQEYKREILREEIQKLRPNSHRRLPTVVSIEDAGEEDVYDFEVRSDCHSAWANGFEVHNCSEFLFINDSACNLASINLIKFYDFDKKLFALPKLKHTVELLIEAMDRLVDIGSYPTEEIERNSKLYRPLGLGITNLGGLLMAMGLPYDSDEGRHVAASLMALITAWSYQKSHELAADNYFVYEDGNKHKFGSYMELNDENALATLRVIKRHAGAINDLILNSEDCEMGKQFSSYLIDAHRVLTNICVYERFVKNSQVTVIAPTGTISFVMDASTTGCEPAYSLVYDKKLAMSNTTLRMPLSVVHQALDSLGYAPSEVDEIVDMATKRGSMRGLVSGEEEKVFECASDPYYNNVSVEGHMRMLEILQPFVSGGISKTINLPNSASIEDIEDAITDCWGNGIKAVTFYRDGSKAAQVLQVSSTGETCYNCGLSMVQTGTCFTCNNCGSSSGACEIL